MQRFSSTDHAAWRIREIDKEEQRLKQTMRHSESLANLSSAFVKAQAQFPSVAKRGVNDFHGYKYAKLEDYIDAIESILKDNGLAIISGVKAVTPIHGRIDKQGKPENAVLVEMEGRLLHTSGEYIETSAFGEGQDKGDKSTYKATTGARKYLIASLCNLPTHDDPESDSDVDKRNEHESQQNRRTGNAPSSNGSRPAAQSSDLASDEQLVLSNFLLKRKDAKSDDGKYDNILISGNIDSLPPSFKMECINPKGGRDGNKGYLRGPNANIDVWHWSFSDKAYKGFIGFAKKWLYENNVADEPASIDQAVEQRYGGQPESRGRNVWGMDNLSEAGSAPAEDPFGW